MAVTLFVAQQRCFLFCSRSLPTLTLLERRAEDREATRTMTPATFSGLHGPASSVLQPLAARAAAARALLAENAPPARMSYRGTSLIRNSAPLGPYSRTMPRALRWF